MGKDKRRKVDVVVVSDVHLGTYGCKAKELLNYLNTKKIKGGVKSALKYIHNFEETAAEIALFNHYDYVVCGHIHQPQIRKISNKQGEQVIYLNSGDWVENLSSLEYNHGSWSVYYYADDPVARSVSLVESSIVSDLYKVELENKQLFKAFLQEFEQLPLEVNAH